MRVGELAALTGVSVRSLRYYEQQGLIDPQRTSAGHRVYTSEHQAVVMQIQELFRAGFCSSVIQELLPALTDPVRNETRLEASLAAARARLEGERDSIDDELTALEQLRDRLGLAPDTRVMPEGDRHDDNTPSQAAATHHRDRRLRPGRPVLP